MEHDQPAKPQTQPSIDQLRATRETLEQLGAPSDDSPQATEPQQSSEQQEIHLNQTSVQPSAGIVEELAGTGERQPTPPDEHNNRDAAADVLSE